MPTIKFMTSYSQRSVTAYSCSSRRSKQRFTPSVGGAIQTAPAGEAGSFCSFPKSLSANEISFYKISVRFTFRVGVECSRSLTFGANVSFIIVIFHFLYMKKWAEFTSVYVGLKGLSETARTVDVVVIATGEDCPMTRRIGRALEKVDHLLRKDGNPRVRFVGLMPWSHVSQREFLTVQVNVKQLCFIYRTQLVKVPERVAKASVDGGALVVAVLWGGSAGSITQAETRINRHIPLVLLQPTNGAVDVISKAMDFHRAYKDDFEEFSSNEKGILQAMLNNLKSDIPADDAMADLQRLFIDWRLLVFHDIDSNIKLHTTLFDAFSKHRFTAGDYVEFSLKWNRVDKIMLLDPNYLSKIPHARRNNLFASALLADRYPFIPIFVKMGVDLNTIVTPNLLHTLYNESPRVNGLLQLLHASGALRHQPESKQPDFEDKLHLVPLKPRISDTARCCPVIINLHDIHILLRAALGSFDCPEYFSDYKV
ncbi:unnamed protein product [Schistocephalus solidus]|uniref:LSDAT_euk domain-containing protein n=1 Tax=Schistocephalus solidus TaxID=70667 RepID=A0A183TCG6_SCHSO|nr:unnamed protein product [Schistocephalus solidus]